MKFGNLEFDAVNEHPELLAEPSLNALKNESKGFYVSEIDESLSDTAAFCEEYQIQPEDCANCVILQAKRGEEIWYAAILILANNRADVNGIIRKQLNAKKVSFAPMELATSLTQMEYGAITPIGLPDDWEILIDDSVIERPHVIIGSGIRKSKLLVEPSLLSGLPNANVMDLKKQ